MSILLGIRSAIKAYRAETGRNLVGITVLLDTYEDLEYEFHKRYLIRDPKVTRGVGDTMYINGVRIDWSME